VVVFVCTITNYIPPLLCQTSHCTAALPLSLSMPLHQCLISSVQRSHLACSPIKLPQLPHCVAHLFAYTYFLNPGLGRPSDLVPVLVPLPVLNLVSVPVLLGLLSLLFLKSL